MIIVIFFLMRYSNYMNLKMRIKRHIGKASGFLLGLLATGNFIGALLSSMLGYFLFDFKENIHNHDNYDSFEDQVFAYKANILQSILSLIVYLLMLKRGKLLRSDVQMIKEYFLEKFNFDMNDIVMIDKNIATIMHRNDFSDIKQIVLTIKQSCNYRERMHVLELLFLLDSSGEAHEEIIDINQIASLLNIKRNDLNLLKSRFCDMADYYSILEIDPGASQAEIKKAYRRLCVLHHPDKAGTKYNKLYFQKIVTAYELLSKNNSKTS